jgi:hypothetical protein
MNYIHRKLVHTFDGLTSSKRKRHMSKYGVKAHILPSLSAVTIPKFPAAQAVQLQLLNTISSQALITIAKCAFKF